MYLIMDLYVIFYGVILQMMEKMVSILLQEELDIVGVRISVINSFIAIISKQFVVLIS